MVGDPTDSPEGIAGRGAVRRRPTPPPPTRLGAIQDHGVCNVRRLTIARISNYPIVWLLPLIAVVGLFFLYPVVEVLRFSLTDASLLRARYVYTLDTFVRVLTDPRLVNQLRVTAIFVVLSVAFQLVLGLLIAMAVRRGGNRRLLGSNVIRLIVLSAWIIPGVAAGIVWRFIFSEASFGLLTSLLRSWGLPHVAWLSNVNMALVSVTIANIWRGTAFSMILQYAGLQSIPQELYEAASVDGASGFQVFWHVTLPQLRTVILINTILITIFTLNTFDLVLALTGGGPGRATEVLSLFTYNAVFRGFDLGAGSVLAVLMLAISIGMTTFYVRLLPRD